MNREDDPLQVSEHEFGRVRVLTAAFDPAEASAITASNVHKLLGDVDLDAEKIEVIPSQALEGLGLTAYLAEGYGIAPEDLRDRAAQLDAVSGLLVFLPSSAFRRKAQTLDPNPALSLLGVFDEIAAEAPDQMPPPDAAKGMVAPLESQPSVPQAAKSASWIFAIGAILVAGGLAVLLLR